MRGNAPAFLRQPPSLAGLPKAVLKQLEAAEALLFALDTRNRPPAFAIAVYLAFGQLRAMFDAARVQQQRIQRTRRRISRAGLLRRGHRALFYEVHFYLICWARVQKLAQYVTDKSGFSRAKLVLKRHRALLNRMTVFRDHLEHFEERLPGGPRRRALRVAGDLFNISGTLVSIGGEQVDVGAGSLHRLVSLVEEFETAVLYDALEELAQRESSGVPHQVQRAAVSVAMDRKLRQVRQMLRNSQATRLGSSQE